MVLEFMARTGKTLQQLIKEVYNIVGPSPPTRDDLHIEESRKQAVIDACKNNTTKAKALPRSITEVYRRLQVLLRRRPLGDDPAFRHQEPVLRVYAQAYGWGGERRYWMRRRKVLVLSFRFSVFSCFFSAASLKD
ncbi:MAG: hypothetical protein IPG32_21460 [Saprospirales bacterium]|nr:hypothetical protein [Saprospirales bacterium]